MIQGPGNKASVCQIAVGVKTLRHQITLFYDPKAMYGEVI